MPKYIFCDDCECEIKEGQDFWEVDVYNKFCETCYDDYLEELKYVNRKTNEKDIDNEVEEMMLERGE